MDPYEIIESEFGQNRQIRAPSYPENCRVAPHKRPLFHWDRPYLARHEGKVEVFSFAGSKGRQVIGEETYDSEEYKKARSDRSAAESRIFTLKFNHGYEDLMRRGLEAVRHEQLTKVLSYNICRLVWLREEKARAERDARLKKAA